MSPTFRRRRALPRVRALLLTWAALAVFCAASATAAPYTGAASVAVSNSNPCQGAPVTLTGVGYVPGSTEVLTIGTTVIGRAVADGQGDFSITVTLPKSLVGQRTITVAGPSGGQLATTRITIERCGNGGTDPGGSGVDAGSIHNGDGAGGEGLSTTGVAVFGLAGVAVLLILGGAVLAFGGRRRRAAPPAD